MDVRNVTPWTDLAQTIQASAAAAGVKIELLPMDGKQPLTKYRARNQDIYIGQWGADYQDPTPMPRPSHPTRTMGTTAHPRRWHGAIPGTFPT